MSLCNFFWHFYFNIKKNLILAPFIFGFKLLFCVCHEIIVKRPGAQKPGHNVVFTYIMKIHIIYTVYFNLDKYYNKIIKEEILFQAKNVASLMII